ncbi:MAG: hypothetical protein N2259_01515 [Patescibacteria group bacterium]|nr:hypothetical protein [Patescibacteria group bacterium]
MKKATFFFKKSRLFGRLFLLALSLFFLAIPAVLAQTWQEPTQPPPQGQLPGPVWLQGSLPGTLQSGNVLFNGQLGIGTVNPAERMELTAPSGTTCRLRITDTDTNENPELQLKYGTGTNDHWAIYVNKSNNSLRFWGSGTNNDDRFTILPTGNLGIGTTSPGYKLDVSGDVRWTGILQGGSVPWARLTSFPSACPSGQYVTAVGPTLTCSLPSGLLPSGTTGQTLRHSGSAWVADSNLFNNGTNVGIGTTSPIQKLDINGAINVRNGIIQKGTNAISGTDLGLYSQGSGEWIRFVTNSGTFAWYKDGGYGSTPIMTLSPAGKLLVNEIDPIYEIEGIKYATYGHSTVGLKEEVVGKLRLQMSNDKFQMPEVENQIYLATIDFNRTEKGSDLWLFRQITAFGQNWQDLVVNLTPEGRAQVWYEFQPTKNQLLIYGTAPINVSYRLIAPRFDWPGRATNLASDQNTSGLKVR